MRDGSPLGGRTPAHPALTSARQHGSMHTWRALIGSLLAAIGSGLILAEFPAGAIDLAAGVALIAALALLARSAIRWAAEPTPRDTSGPPHDG